MPMPGQVEIEFNLLGGIRKDAQANVFVGFCPRFKLYSQGRTNDEAHAAIRSAVYGYIRALYEIGTLNEVMQEAGFAPTSADATGTSAYPAAEWVALRRLNFDPIDMRVKIPMGVRA